LLHIGACCNLFASKVGGPGKWKLLGMRSGLSGGCSITYQSGHGQQIGHSQHSSKFVICFVLFVICVVLLLIVMFYVLFMCKCVLPLGVNPIAVDKYISHSTVISQKSGWRTLISSYMSADNRLATSGVSSINELSKMEREE
jgi:hypothetical protein